MQGVGLVEDWGGAGANMGPVDMVMGVGVIILGGCPLPFSVKQQSSAFSMILGNQLGNTFVVRGFYAKHWVGMMCSCGVGVLGEAECQGRGLGGGLISSRMWQLL